MKERWPGLLEKAGALGKKYRYVALVILAGVVLMLLPGGGEGEAERVTAEETAGLGVDVEALERRMEEGVPVAITQAAPSEKPKEKPKPKRRPPALPEDRKEVQEKWALLRNDVEDAVLKAKLAQVEIGFKEDEFLYLICAYPALTDMIQRGMDKIAAVLEKETGKSFELRTTTKDEYEKWREAAYGKEEETPSAEADAEFASLLGQYFPEADVE